MKKLVISLALAAVAGNAVALAVTIDTDSYDIGTNISHVDSNTWIQAVNYSGSAGFTYSDVYVADIPKLTASQEFYWDGAAEGFGSHSFGRQTEEGLVNHWQRSHFYDFVRQGQHTDITHIDVIGVRFFDPVQHLEIRALGGADMSYVWAYDISGNLISSLRQTIPNSITTGGRYLQDLEISRNQADIAYVVFGGGGASSRFNQITYDVPAPAPLAPLGIGLAFGALAGTRKKFCIKNEAMNSIAT